MSLTKRVIFGLIAVVVIPALFYVLLEQGLRVLGFGKSFDYFNKIDVDGHEYFQDNPVFGQQFYPASLGIKPMEITFSAEPDENLVRVFVLGGSAAKGFPNPDHGFSRHLEALLNDALPSRQVEVISTAMTAVNSHVVYETARSIPQGSADFAIVLLGNNEVVGPYGPGTFNQNFLSNLGLIRSLQAVKRSRIGQGLLEVASNINRRDDKKELRWKGMQMFTDSTVPQSDARLESVYDHYQQNLEDIVRILQRKGAHVLLSSVPVNLRQSAPFSSVHKPGLTDEQMDQWESAVSRANAGFDKQDWETAILEYTAAEAIDSDYADTHFRLAVAYENIQDFQQASEHYEKARDLDGLRFRADSRINLATRTVASEFANNQLTFVDNESAFNRESHPYRPGWNLFLEHVHFDFSGNYLLAREFAGSILDNLEVDGYIPLPQAEIAERIGYPNNRTVKVMNQMLEMAQSPPFTGQSNHAELEHFIDTRNSQLKSRIGTISDLIQRRQEIIQRGQGDWRLSFELADIFEKTKNRPGAYQQLSRVFAQYPHDRVSHMMVAKMLHKDQKFRQEIPHLKRALNYTRGDRKLDARITGWLGLTYFKLGEHEPASEYLLEVARNYPEQIHATLQAYGTLIKYSMQSGSAEDVDDYVDEAQRYAENIVSSGRDKEYPKLYMRMAQIMRLAGQESQARRWKERHPEKLREQRAANT